MPRGCLGPGAALARPQCLQRDPPERSALGLPGALLASCFSPFLLLLPLGHGDRSGHRRGAAAGQDAALLPGLRALPSRWPPSRRVPGQPPLLGAGAGAGAAPHHPPGAFPFAQRHRAGGGAGAARDGSGFPAAGGTRGPVRPGRASGTCRGTAGPSRALRAAPAPLPSAGGSRWCPGPGSVAPPCRLARRAACRRGSPGPLPSGRPPLSDSPAPRTAFSRGPAGWRPRRRRSPAAARAPAAGSSGVPGQPSREPAEAGAAALPPRRAAPGVRTSRL